MNKQDREMGLLAKATLKANPNMGLIAKCNRDLDANELTLTVITFASGAEVKCWNEAKGLQVRGVALKYRQEIAKVEYVVTDRASKKVLRIKNSFRLEGNDLVQA